jgi:isochorismate pyruvate lyase
VGGALTDNRQLMSETLAPEACASLADVRQQIDRLDRAIVALLAERGRYVLAAARYKRTPAEVHAPARVEQVIAHVRRLAEEAGTSPAVVEHGYRALIAAYTVVEQAERERLG